MQNMNKNKQKKKQTNFEKVFKYNAQFHISRATFCISNFIKNELKNIYIDYVYGPQIIMSKIWY